MERRFDIEEEIRDYFSEAYEISLNDSPQILNDYLYIEYWGLDRDVKLRIPYPVNKEHFIKMNSVDRNVWISLQVLNAIIRTSRKTPGIC